MFEFKFTTSDLIRAGWTFLFAALGYVVIVQPESGAEWKAAATGALAAGLSAVKNLVLADGTRLKG